MIIVDVETSGLDPRHHGILSIGAVVAHPAPHAEFYMACGLADDQLWTPEALKVNGFSARNLYNPDLIHPSRAIRSFLDWADSHAIAGCTLGNVGIGFDAGFLRAAAARWAGDHWPFGHRYVDIHSVAFAFQVLRGKNPEGIRGYSGLSLNEILALFDEPPEPTPHNALVGAKMANLAWRHLLTELEGSKSRLVWKCACGWVGYSDSLNSNPSGCRVCPTCGGSGGLAACHDKEGQ